MFSLPLLLFLSPSFFFFTSPTLATNQAQFLLGGLETGRWWFFSLSRAVPGMRSASHLVGNGGGLLKGNAHSLPVFTRLRDWYGKYANIIRLSRAFVCDFEVLKVRIYACVPRLGIWDVLFAFFCMSSHLIEGLFDYLKYDAFGL